MSVDTRSIDDIIKCKSIVAVIGNYADDSEQEFVMTSSTNTRNVRRAHATMACTFFVRISRIDR